MAGSYEDQAALANNILFIPLVKTSLIKRVAELHDTADAAVVSARAGLASAQAALVTAQNTLSDAQLTSNIYAAILADSEKYAARMAHLIAETNATIGAAAPAVPSSGDTQFATNTLLPLLIS